jgi:nitrous oxidase accessory protein
MENLGTENITISYNVIEENGVGIRNKNSAEKLVISNNEIISNGIAFDGYIRNSSITNNYIFSNGFGIKAGTNCIIAGNGIIQNSNAGILVQSFNRIENNNIVKNDMGIRIDGYENTVTNNVIQQNQEGIHFLSTNKEDLVRDNLVYSNNFIKNTVQIETQIQFSADKSLGSNNWDNGEIGNYWSIYRGKDNDKDGIGDSALIINKNNQDNYPLMEPVETGAIPEFPSWTILPLVLTFTLFLVIIKRNISKHKNLQF